MTGTPEENQPHQPPPSSPRKPDQSEESHQIPITGESASTPTDEDTEKWGTHIMGTPAVPTIHPDNQKAALWGAEDHQRSFHHHQPYLQHSPIDKSNTNPLEPVIHMFNSWSSKAETVARNIWHNLKTGPSVPGAAWGKLNLTAKAITEGGYESLFKQIFATESSEKLKKTFACYLSTTTGPVAGTLYLSTAHVAFCSDRPLSFPAPSGQESWSYYKIMIPLTKIGSVNPVTMREKPLGKYIHIVTVDGHDFWFMGFVNFEKASHHLTTSVSDYRAVGPAVEEPTSVSDYRAAGPEVAEPVSSKQI
ncbi:GEM-like protein 5 [Cornus florida]|uniref:GEM-like protein 5 n=1 Tax=Cornus florida TaxID=4283 RepID=UPI00289FF676|nr:GEM-like protein 5 [Cornus florida]